jgi:F-type H+-transporting ATPase subunit delta
MKLTKESRKLSKELFRASFANGALDSARVSQISEHVAQAKPRNYIGVLKELARLIRLELAKKQATIESVTDLDAGEKSEITRALRAKYGADVTTEFKTNAGILGGIRIQIGSDVLDATVRTRLDRLSVDLAA